MGYRSEVVSAIAMPSLDFVYELAAKYKLQGGKDWVVCSELLDNSIVRTCKVGKQPWLEEKSDYHALPEGCLWYIWEFHVSEWKWYEGYAAVEMWDSIHSKEAMEKGLYSVFHRIGEDEGDIEVDFFEPQCDGELSEYMRAIGMFPSATDEQWDSYVKQYDGVMSTVNEPYRIYSGVDKDFPESDDVMKLNQLTNNEEERTA